MIRVFFTFLFLLLSLNHYSQEPLPKWMTDAEKQVWGDYLKNYPTHKGTTPPNTPPRTPGEWEEAQGVIITWASYTSNLREIVRHAVQFVKVYIVCSNPSEVESYLSQGGISLDNIEFVVAPFNSVWVRDYGPQSVYLHETNELAFVDWVYNRPRPNDDEIPSVMANYLGVPLFQMTQAPNRLIATGGNFMTDSYRKGYSSKLIFEENNSLTEAQIDTIKKRYMGIEPYVKMTTLPYDGIHHIDMHMKLLDEETLLVGKYPDGVADGPQIEQNLQYVINNYQTPYGRPYRVVRIPMPSDENGNYPPNSHYLTYTNAIILNGLVLVPIYGRPQDDEALNTYREAMPGYTVVGINMRNVISALGAIHCITREIAANDPILIGHAAVRGEANYSESGYPIKAHVSSASGISKARLFWKTDGSKEFNIVPMTLEQDTFRAVIPNQLENTNVSYYINATNNNFKTISKPLVAPQGYYSFIVGENNYGYDFYSSNYTTETFEDVSFTFIDQGVEAESFLWDFGEGAVPSTATTEGPHTVQYETIGTKDISLSINGELVLTKPAYVSVTEQSTTYHTIKICTDGDGTTNPEVGEYDFEDDSQLTLTAYPNDGWKFEKWTINDVSFSDNDVDILITSDIEAVAFFAEIPSRVEVENISSLEIFPNPASSAISIKLPKAIENGYVSVINLSGQKMLNKPFNKLEDKVIFDISLLPKGVYIISVESNSEALRAKFVKL